MNINYIKNNVSNYDLKQIPGKHVNRIHMTKLII